MKYASESMQNKSEVILNSKYSIVLGILLQSEDVNSAFVKLVFSVLKRAISKSKSYLGLRHMCRFLIHFSVYLPQKDDLMRLFWIAIMLVQLSNEDSMPDSIELLATLVDLINR